MEEQIIKTILEFLPSGLANDLNYQLKEIVAVYNFEQIQEWINSKSNLYSMEEQIQCKNCSFCLVDSYEACFAIPTYGYCTNENKFNK